MTGRDTRATALRQLYPDLGAIETRPAWRTKDEAPCTYDRAIPLSLRFAEDAARWRRRARS
jgi:hypothetical protein